MVALAMAQLAMGSLVVWLVLALVSAIGWALAFGDLVRRKS